jgi:drug/metabolite transporter (DMT)-like permease
MWLILAFVSAALLGCYDSFKKDALSGNAVIPVLFLNTMFSSFIFLPFVFVSLTTTWLDGSIFYVSSSGWEVHRYIILKSCIVLSSWLFGYFGMKHLPLTIVGPINATRPMMVLIGAIFVFGETLNPLQWTGVVLGILSFFLLSRSEKKEGIDFMHNRWIFLLVLGAALGAASGLYDKFLMASPENGGLGINRMVMQSYYNFYQAGLMALMLAFLWWPQRKQYTPFSWRWTIPLISIFLSAADFVYFYSLSLDGALISVVSLARRSSVVVSFLVAAMLFHEKNLRSKAIDLALVLLGMLFLYYGSK